MNKLLFTGASGFLGNNLILPLREMYEVKTLGLTDSIDIKVNLAKDIPEIKDSFDVILHAAGKAHSIPKTDKEKKIFFDVNYQGTVNLCHGLEKCAPPKAFVFISTVAVYGCDFGENITEEHPLNGTTPYAKSKIMAENYLRDWCAKHDVRLSILRPSLIAGPNAPGNLGAMVEAIKRGRYVNIGGGNTRKSVLMVEDIVRLLSSLIEKGGIYNVCDNRHPSVGELSALIAKQLGRRKPMNVPAGIIKLAAKAGDFLGDRFPLNSLRYSKLTSSLTFCNEKARKELGWEPLDVLENYKIE